MSATTEASTTTGRIRGVKTGDVFAFKGIPYAAPPVGPLRFRAPQRAAAWSGVRDATSFGPIAPQLNPSPLLHELTGMRGEAGDDCLSLNVWTPDPGAARLPVMIWIHPGGYTLGSSSSELFDGSTFARSGAVLVSINYRLGAMGFLHLDPSFGDVECSGNFGIADQVLALKWVQENIASFGGDPDRVTIFGQSGGAHSVCTLLATPSAKGLFRRAISQSGGGRNILRSSTAERIGSYFLANAGIRAGDLHALRELSTDQILTAHAAVYDDVQQTHDPERFAEAALSGMMAFHPVVGGDILPDTIDDAITAGSAREVDLIIGTAEHEMRLSLLDSEGMGPSEAILGQMVDSVAKPVGRSGTEIVDLYRRNRPDVEAFEIVDAVLTDQIFRIPSIRIADEQTAHRPNTWMYEFGWRSAEFEGRLGAGHSVDVPFVFDTLSVPSAKKLLGPAAPQGLADVLHGTWIEFADRGIPAHPNLAPWPQYTRDRRATMRFADDTHVVDDPRREERLLWDGIL